MSTLEPHPPNVFSMTGPFGALATAMAEAVKAEICTPGTSQVASRAYDHSLGTALEDAVLQTWVSQLFAQDVQGEALRTVLVRHLVAPAPVESDRQAFSNVLPEDHPVRVTEPLRLTYEPALCVEAVVPSPADIPTLQEAVFVSEASREVLPESAVEEPAALEEAGSLPHADASMPPEVAPEEVAPVATEAGLEPVSAEPTPLVESVEPARDKVLALREPEPEVATAEATDSLGQVLAEQVTEAIAETMAVSAVADLAAPDRLTLAVAAEQLRVSIPYVRMLCTLGKLTATLSPVDGELYLGATSLEHYAATRAAKSRTRRA